MHCQTRLPPSSFGSMTISFGDKTFLSKPRHYFLPFLNVLCDWSMLVKKWCKVWIKVSNGQVSVISQNLWKVCVKSVCVNEFSLRRNMTVGGHFGLETFIVQTMDMWSEMSTDSTLTEWNSGSDCLWRTQSVTGPDMWVGSRTHCSMSNSQDVRHMAHFLLAVILKIKLS